jgi:hypothetical protein
LRDTGLKSPREHDFLRLFQRLAREIMQCAGGSPTCRAGPDGPAYALRQGLFPEVRLAKSYKATSIQPIAIGVRKSDGELLSKFDAAIAELNTDGTVQQIIAKWGLD